MRVLLAQNDPQLTQRLDTRLREAGFSVEIADSQTLRDEQGAPVPPHDIAAIILDMALPDSRNLLHSWATKEPDVPVLTLTPRGSWRDKVEAMKAGAADFVVKPVRFEELLARLHTALRRRDGPESEWIGRDGLRLDPQGRTVELEGRQLRLTRAEFRLLHLFLRHARQVLSQEDILDQLYDPAQERHFNAIEVLISRLRRKIGPGRIETVRGLGYRLAA
ncbi:MAG: response regulator transcription factor [Sphingomonadales bacterium]|nr:response regulator transcription factor [Sphingomonadales bacterium]MDE2170549.1 response regulator transcription factor [Sphingomonadales bacterium]